MANIQAGFGFAEFGRQDGGAPTAGLTRVFVLSSDTTAIFRGDPVQQSSSPMGYYVTQATTGTVGVAGVFMGCEYYNSAVQRVVWSNYFPASVGSSNPVTAYIKNDPESLFICQGSTAAVLGTSVVGLNIGFLSTANGLGNTLNGISAITLQSTTVSANSSLPFRIVDVYSNYAPPGVNGTDNASVGAIMVVAPNNWSRKNLTGTSTT